MTSTSIAEVIPLPLDSCVETLGDKTDFSKIGFTIKTKKNKVITEEDELMNMDIAEGRKLFDAVQTRTGLEPGVIRTAAGAVTATARRFPALPLLPHQLELGEQHLEGGVDQAPRLPPGAHPVVH